MKKQGVNGRKDAPKGNASFQQLRILKNNNLNQRHLLELGLTNLKQNYKKVARKINWPAIHFYMDRKFVLKRY